MLKRAVAVLSLVGMALGLAACGGEGAAPAGGQPPRALAAVVVQSDAIVFSGPRANYLIGKIGPGFVVADNVGGDGVRSVPLGARLRFTDTSVSLDFDGIAGQAYRLYQAAFGRTPDTAGLSYWITAMNNGATLGQVAAGFAQSDEFKALYGANPTNAQIVDRYYQNVLHRPGEAAGIAFWLSVLETHGDTPAGVLAGFCESPENKAGVLAGIQSGIAFLEAGIIYAAPGEQSYLDLHMSGSRDFEVAMLGTLEFYSPPTATYIVSANRGPTSPRNGTELVFHGVTKTGLKYSLLTTFQGKGLGKFRVEQDTDWINSTPLEMVSLQVEPNTGPKVGDFQYYNGGNNMDKHKFVDPEFEITRYDEVGGFVEGVFTGELVDAYSWDVDKQTYQKKASIHARFKARRKPDL